VIRLLVLGNDLSSAALMDHIRREKKETSYSYVAFPAKPIEEEIAKTPLDDAALMAWIEELPANEQQVYRDSNHAALSILGLLLAEFDPNDWTVELQDFKLDETVIEARYTRDRDTRYRKEPESKPDSRPENGGGSATRSGPWPETREGPPAGGGGNKDGEGAKDDGKEQDGNEDQDPNGNVQETTPATNPAPPAQEGPDVRAAGDQAAGDPATRPATHPATRAADGAPVIGPPTTDQATYVPLAEVRDEIEKRLRVEAVLGVLLTKAQARAKEVGEAFDFVQWAAELRKEKDDPRGLVVLEQKEPKSAEELKTLEQLGEWSSSFQVGYMQTEGDFAGAPQPTSEGALIFRAEKIVKEPFKEIAEIRADAAADRVKKQAMAQAKQACEDLVAALREKAKAKVPEEVAKLQADQDAEAAARLAAWKAKQESRLADIEKILARGLARATAEYTPVKERIQKELAAIGDQEQKIRDAVTTEFETKLHETVAPHLGEVLDEVAKEKGLTVQRIEPFLADIATEPDYKTRYPDPVVRFLIESSSLKEVQQGRVSPCLEDMTNRAHAVVRVDDRKLPPESAITRTEFRQGRRSFEEAVLRGALNQAFSFEALKARYRFTPSRGEEVDLASRPSN
jgi:hypothetical protein